MTALPNWGLDEFTTSFQAHLPTGRAWPREPDTVQRQAVGALMPTYVRSWAAAQALLIDSFPATAVFLLPEWEASVGLPDPCAGEDATVAARQAHVVARLTQSEGPTIASITAYAATLGYAITIEEFAASVFGMSFGAPFGGEDWAHTWRVHAPMFSVTDFTFSINTFGDYWSAGNNLVLQCELARLKPAQTILQFAFDGVLAAPLRGLPEPLDRFALDRTPLF